MDELDRIRERIERSSLTINPGDSTEDLVARLISLSWPETAGAMWFKRWQVANQGNNALRVALSGLLVKLDADDPVDQASIDDAWSVLRDVQHLMPEVASR
jgi:hypothetical protein